jgi:predicted DCC family thiol-disulfide oxidoreductase YuxK
LNAGYDFIARIRYRLFARPDDVCPILPKHLRDRFQF